MSEQQLCGPQQLAEGERTATLRMTISLENSAKPGLMSMHVPFIMVGQTGLKQRTNRFIYIAKEIQLNK